jgi:hypothetical protein
MARGSVLGGTLGLAAPGPVRTVVVAMIGAPPRALLVARVAPLP